MIYPSNQTTPRSGNYLWNWLGSPLKKFAQALAPYLGGGGDNRIYGEIELTSSQIQNELFDDGIVLVPNPGPGKYVVFHEVVLEYTAGTIQYTTGTSNELYVNRTGIRFNKDIMVGHLESRYAVSMDYSTYVQSTLARSIGYAINFPDDYTLNCDDTFDDGDGTLKIKYYYTIRTFG